MKLNLGCGLDYRPGWINVDKVPRIRTDICFDFEMMPWPFPDNYIDEVWCYNVIEHIKEIPDFMDELWRVCKSGAIVRIGTAYGKSDGAIRDTTHWHLLTEKSMDDFCAGNDWYSAHTWILESSKLGVCKTRLRHFIRNFVPFRRLLRYFFWNMYDTVDFVLRKP